jgi:small subunit ribosomal protein S17
MPSKKEPKREGGAAAEDAVEQEQDAPESGVEEAIAEEREVMVAEEAAVEEMAAEEMVAEEPQGEEDVALEAVAEEEAVAEPENEAVMPAAAVKGPATAPQKELPEYLRRRRSEVGQVVSAKMMKTVVVAVQRSKPHPLYKKIVRKTAKFMAHDELGAKTGDTVRIIESRPMSRHKRWQVVEIVQKAQQL